MFTPDKSTRARHRHSQCQTHILQLISCGEEMGVLIVGLPDKYDGGFHPFIEGCGTYVLPGRNDIEIFFPVQEIEKLLMNIAAAIETGVYDDSLLPDIP